MARSGQNCGETRRISQPSLKTDFFPARSFVDSADSPSPPGSQLYTSRHRHHHHRHHHHHHLHNRYHHRNAHNVDGGYGSGGSKGPSRTSNSSDSSSAYSGSDTMQSSVDVEEVDLTGLMESVVDSDEEEEEEEDSAVDETGLLVRDTVRDCLEKDPSDR